MIKRGRAAQPGHQEVGTMMVAATLAALLVAAPPPNDKTIRACERNKRGKTVGFCPELVITDDAYLQLMEVGDTITLDRVKGGPGSPRTIVLKVVLADREWAPPNGQPTIGPAPEPHMHSEPIHVAALPDLVTDFAELANYAAFGILAVMALVARFRPLASPAGLETPCWEHLRL